MVKELPQIELARMHWSPVGLKENYFSDCNKEDLEKRE